MANGRPGRPKKVETENTTNNISENTEKNVDDMVNATTELQVSTRKKLKLDDNVSLLASSNIFGELIYINHKTGSIVTGKQIGRAHV